MLVLSRRPQEEIVIGDNIILTIAEIRGDKVRVGITAPRSVSAARMELLSPDEQQAVRLAASKEQSC